MVTHTRNLAFATLVAQLRSAATSRENVAAMLRRSVARLRNDVAYARSMRGDLGRLLSKADATRALAEEGILTDERLFEGALRRILSRIAPLPGRDGSLAQMLASWLEDDDLHWIGKLEQRDLSRWIEALMQEASGERGGTSLTVDAIALLAGRVAGAALETRFLDRVNIDEDGVDGASWVASFQELSIAVGAYVAQTSSAATDPGVARRAVDAVDGCADEISRVRRQSAQRGTSLELSSTALRMSQQLARLRMLLLATDTNRAASAEATAALAIEVLTGHLRRHRPVEFLRQKLDLLAYVVVGHAAKKGEIYLVEKAAEYRSFIGKSALGGLLVAIFACVKLALSGTGLAPLPQGLLYGLNYAL